MTSPQSTTPIPPSAERPATASTASVPSDEAVARSSGDLLRLWARRIRHGESGMLPVLGGLVIIVVIFQIEDSHFLTAGNITNLFIQSTWYVLLGMAEIFVLLIAEIDLSLGYGSAIAAVYAVSLTSSNAGWPWWAAALAGILITGLIGAVQGLIITKLRIPSFVVTLGGLLGLEGLLIYLANRFGGKSGGGVLPMNNHTLSNLANGNLSPTVGWIALAVVLVLFASVVLRGDHRLRTSGLVAPPRSLAYAKIGVVAVAGIILVAVCNTNRGRLVPVRGVPWAVPIVLVVVLLCSFLLRRTRFGRYVYAVGGNAEAARRAGVNLNRIRLLCFTLGGLVAGIAGLMYSSYLGSISSNVDGGQLVLYAVAAAVIGGTSLLGGRGRMVHALVGGLIVATIYNGMGLIGLSADIQDMVIALVLLAAVSVDALSRRNSSAA